MPVIAGFFRAVWVMAMLASLALVLSAHADASGVLYAGTMADGSWVFMQVEIAEDGSARVSARSEPRHWVAEGGPHFDAWGTTEGSEGALVVTGTVDAWRGEPIAGTPWRPEAEGLDPAPVEIRVWAAAVEGGPGSFAGQELDPFGFAALTITESNPPGDVPNPLQIRLGAVGTVFESNARLLDGSLSVNRKAPFFYEPIWTALDLAAVVQDNAGGNLAEGLGQRRDHPQSVAGLWSDERTAVIMSFSESMASVLYFDYAYRGGAHPNTYRTAETFLRGEGGWAVATLCDALVSLDVPCAERRIREHILAELGAKEASWVLDGTVGVDTPWLLDTFTIVPWAVRFDFSPYEVGPYAQGPFTVHIPFRELLRR